VAEETFQEMTRGEQGGCPDGKPHNPAGNNQHTERNRFSRDSITVEPQPERKRDYSREAPTITSVSYAVRRLTRERPDLYERVKAALTLTSPRSIASTSSGEPLTVTALAWR